MCRNRTSWDNPLPKELQPNWEHWKVDLVNLKKISIPRCYVPANFGNVIKRELHHFSDASNSGYGQCTYLRLTNEEGNINCALVIGKFRVAPIKVQTIPRLELTAAVISVAMSNMLKQELEYADIEEHFWTDSQVVLGYINNEAPPTTNFVGAKNELKNALKEIDVDRLTVFLAKKQCAYVLNAPPFKSCWWGMRETNQNSEECSSLNSLILFWQTGRCITADILL